MSLKWCDPVYRAKVIATLKSKPVVYTKEREELRDEVARLWAQKEPQLSCSKIGTILGISKNAVIGIAHRMKLEPRPSPILNRPPAVWTAERIEAARLRRNALQAKRREIQRTLRPKKPAPVTPPITTDTNIKFETVEEFVARGGKIKRFEIKPAAPAAIPVFSSASRRGLNANRDSW